MRARARLRCRHETCSRQEGRAESARRSQRRHLVRLETREDVAVGDADSAAPVAPLPIARSAGWVRRQASIVSARWSRSCSPGCSKPRSARSAVCAPISGWDTLGSPTYRQKLFPAYQSGRKFDDELLEQLDLLPEFVAACGFANAKTVGYEADDFLAAVVADEERQGGRTLVASGDRDAFQLASELTTILHPVRAGEMARIGPAEVRERYRVDPKQVPDFIALRGDPSDKLPGARGVGPKAAAALVRLYGTLEGALAAGRFAEQATELRMYRRIATMDASAPLPALRDQRPTWDKAAVLAREWELNRLAERLEGYRSCQNADE
jgi:DNA polymerase-1